MKNRTEHNILKQVNLLVKSAEDIWIPRWFDLFSSRNGGFHERLDKNGTPIELPRRLLSQCRQIIVYSLASNNAYKDKLNETFEFIKQHYFVPETGGSVFSLNEKNEIHDHTYDLYAHAFILLTCAQYYRATQNKEALTYAKTTLNFIKDNFSLPIGYAESLDNNLNSISAIRRQNPHMHLLEGCIFMYETSNDPAYKTIVDKLIALFLNNFFDHNTGTLGEFFDYNLKSHPQEGHKIEAAHHGEWIWLLSRYKNISDQYTDEINSTTEKLFQFIFNHGLDRKHGGIFNIQNREGDVIQDNKRIWTVFEVLRAANVMRTNMKYQKDSEKNMSNLISTIQENYIDMDTGNWNEVLNKNLTPIIDYLPATTPYHIYPILKEINNLISKT